VIEMSEINLRETNYLNFDQLVIYADLVVKDLAPHSKNMQPGSKEFATLQIAASAFSIIFSIRELIKLGYFPSSRILLRSLLDRTATIAWIRAKGATGIDTWNKGWKYRERPEKLHEKLDCLHHFKIFADDNRPLAKYLTDQGFIEEFHGDSHGDLASTRRNTVFGIDGEEHYVAGPNTIDSGQFIYMTKLSSAVVGQFMKELEISLSSVVPLWKTQP
jgi:hypothetical protein